MASSKERIESLIQENRSNGLNDNQIFSTLARRKDKVGIDIANAGKEMGSRGVADYFGLKLEAQDVNAAHNRDISKTQSRIESVGAGLANVGGAFIQGGAYIADKANQGINKAFGTDLSTGGYEQITKDLKTMNTDVDRGRGGAGIEGTDWVRTGTEIAASIPAFALGGGAGAGVKSAAAFAARQGAIGAGVGAARFAEDGSERVNNMAWGAGGAAVGGLAGEKIVAPVARAGAGMLSRAAANASGRTSEAATRVVDDAVAASDFDIPVAQREQMFNQADNALRSSKDIDSETMLNQALLEKHGIKGTKAQISRYPTEWRDEKELAKLNSRLLSTYDNQIDQFDGLVRGAIDDTGASANNTYAKMDDAYGKLRESDKAAQSNIGQLYDDARGLSGNDAQLNHVRFINQASQELEDNGVGSFMKGDIKGIFKGMFDDPDFKLTHAKSEEINKVLNARLRTTTDGNERHALGIIKDNLQKEVDNTIDELSGSLGSGASDGGLVAAQGAWKAARGAARERFQDIDKIPALKAAIDGKNPDKAFGKFVLNSDLNDLTGMVGQLKKAPEGDQSIADIQGAVMEHFLGQATKSNSGAISPHGLNKAIEDFGEDRMKILFTPEQTSHIKEIKKVSDLLFQQPNGAAVNHSNTAATMKYLMGITNLLGRVPIVGRSANLIGGALSTSDDLIRSGKAYGYIEGSPATTPNSTLGMSTKEKNLILLAEKLAGRRATSPIGQQIGADEARKQNQKDE